MKEKRARFDNIHFFARILPFLPPSSLITRTPTSLDSFVLTPTLLSSLILSVELLRLKSIPITFMSKVLPKKTQHVPTTNIINIKSTIHTVFFKNRILRNFKLNIRHFRYENSYVKIRKNGFT